MTMTITAPPSCALPPATVGRSFFSSPSPSRWLDDHHSEQQQPSSPAIRLQQKQQQHLVEFQGRTLCISSLPKISCVLQAVFSALNVPPQAAAGLEVPWRIMCAGRFLGLEDSAPPLSILRVWTGGLKGGKGGFGAMLRAMAKQV